MQPDDSRQEGAMRYVFGPIPSRRLGHSLGVDPIAFKTCNWNCVYCQLGRSTPLRHERKDYVPPDEVVSEVKEAVAAQGARAIDWITFGGSGEPTLHASLGRMIREVKEATALPVAVLTNGSLLHLPEVQADLMTADAVLPTLDAGTEDVYFRVNRPRPELTFDGLVGGLTAFRRVYAGKLWVEVMLVKGLNDSEGSLRALAEVLEKIEPDGVHINRPVRPPAEGWVEAPSDETLARAAAILGPRAQVVAPRSAILDLTGYGDIEDAVLSILDRHPMSLADLAEALGRWDPEHVDAALAALEETGRVRQVRRLGQSFWASAEARYGWPPAGPDRDSSE
jgi:wyosine [tRNA(Phe)-imidazoG37] synthetase (radical SAM superfamily)